MFELVPSMADTTSSTAEGASRDIGRSRDKERNDSHLECPGEAEYKLEREDPAPVRLAVIVDRDRKDCRGGGAHHDENGIGCVSGREHVLAPSGRTAKPAGRGARA